MTGDETQSNRKRFSVEEKFKVVKEHLTTKTTVTELCKKYGVSLSNFYARQEQFFSAALSGFDKKRGPQIVQSRRDDERVSALEADVHRMREVIAEITSENIAFKKRICHISDSSAVGTFARR
jgi:transposase-like protein